MDEHYMYAESAPFTGRVEWLKSTLVWLVSCRSCSCTEAEAKEANQSVRFNSHFPDGSLLAGTSTSPFWIFIRAKDDGGGEWWQLEL